MNSPHLFKVLALSATLSVVLGAATGCSNASHALLYQQSNLGFNAGINPATQNLAVRVGLRRQFGAIIPKYAKEAGGAAGAVSTGTGETVEAAGYQAASTYFGSRARITSPFRVPEVAEVMATGRAAVIAAQAGNALDFAKTEPTPQGQTENE